MIIFELQIAQVKIFLQKQINKEGEIATIFEDMAKSKIPSEFKPGFICRVQIGKWAEVAGQASDQCPYLSTGALKHWISKYFNQN